MSGTPLFRALTTAVLLFAALLAPRSAPAQPIPLTPDPIAVPTGLDDAGFLAWLQERVDEIGDVRKVRTSDLPRVFRELDSGEVAAEAWLGDHGESPVRAEVLRILARLLFLNQDRVVALADHQNQVEWGARLQPIEIEAILTAHRNRTLGVIQEGLDLAPETGPLRAALLETYGEVMLRAQRHIEAAEALTLSIQADPTRPELDETYIKLAETFILAGDYPRGEAVALEGIVRFPRSKLWPHYFWYYHKVLRHQGKLEQALSAWAQLLPRIRAGAAGEAMVAAGAFVVPEEYRIDYERYAARARFYEGFFLYALGEPERALEAIRAFADHHRERQMDGETLPMDLVTYLDYQADPYDRRISLLQGRPLPDLEGKVDWVQPPTDAAREKPARVRIFASASRALGRQQGMFELLRSLGQEYGEKLHIDWISFALRRGDIADQEVAAMRGAIEAHGIEDWSVAIDVEDLDVHREHGLEAANVTLYLTDAEGRLHWLLIDPMSWDEGLIRRVLQRALGGE